MNSKDIRSNYTDNLVLFVDTLDSITDQNIRSGAYCDGSYFIEFPSDKDPLGAEDDLTKLYGTFRNDKIINLESFYNLYDADTSPIFFLAQVEALLKDRDSRSAE